PRWHLFRQEAGEVLLGLPAIERSSAPISFLAVGGSDTRLYELPLARFQQLVESVDTAEELNAWIDDWIQAWYDALDSGVPPIQFTALKPDRESVLAQSVAARPEKSVVWVRHQQGQSRWCGREEFLCSAASAPMPLIPSAWIEPIDETVVVACTDTWSELQSGCLWPNLAAFHQFTKQWTQTRLTAAGSEELQRLQAKSQAEHDAVKSAIVRLANLLGKEGLENRGEGRSSDDALLAACMRVGEVLGISIRPHPASRSGRPQRDPLGNIAKASRVRIRRVMLTGNWWEQDNGPLLAFLQEENKPVALLPTAPGKYEVLEPISGRRMHVGADQAPAFQPAAYTFSRPFPDRALAVWDLFKFGLQHTRADLFMVLLMGLAGGLVGMLVPIVTGVIFDSVIPSAARPDLLYLIVALMVGAAAGVVFQITRGIALLRVESKSSAGIQGAVWDRLLALPLPFFRNYTSGDLAMRANGINDIRAILSGAVLTSVLSGVFSIFNFALLFYYSVPLALVASVLVTLNIAVTGLISFFCLRYQRPLCALQGKISGQVLQFITGISKLRVAGAEGHAFAVWARNFSAQKKLDLEASTIFNGLTAFHDVYPLVTSLVLFAALAFGSGSGLSTGKFLAFSAAFSTFLYSMISLSGALISILQVIPIYERARPIMNTLPEVSETKSDPGELKGKIELSHVSFRYKADGPLILRDISLQINPGEFAAIVGQSGSGKSTLMRLLLGFDAPESGTIYFDGMDLAGLDIQAVRRQCGVVLQNGKLMPGDIYQNIIGSSLLTLDDAWEAARKAGFDEDIHQMPMGMHTVLSEGAGTLSGGQRQRLMIARAIVARPRILLFDEATSALDNRTQSIVSHSLEKLQATRIIIAHRLSTILKADRIFVIHQGRLVQTGTYEELVHQPGPFAELARRQMA
ncbi:MAG: NHLP bacteriocin export ABC transporter permease/ATPase subunit, partial [Verrucomicrobiota bacterium]